MVLPKTRIGLFTCWLLCSLMLSVAQPSDAPKDSAILHEFEIEANARRIIVPLTIGSRTIPFMIDTGASVGVYDDTLKTLLGTPIRKVTISMSSVRREAELFESAEATIGTLRLPTNTTVFLFDLKPVSRATRCEVRGVIGMNQMRGFCWQIDCDAKKVRVLSRVPEEPGIDVALTYPKTGTPYVACRLAKGLPESFLIDTGSPQSVIVEQRLFDSLVASGQIKVVGQIAASDGNGRMWFPTVGRLRDFSVGEIVLNNLLVLRGGKNVIGMRFLARFVTTLDFPNSKVYLKPGRRFEEPDTTAIQGFSLFFAGEDLTVVTVEQDGPADKAGLKLNDVIVGIDGEEIVGKTIFEIDHMIEKPAQELKLRIRRDDSISHMKIAIPKLAM